MSKINFERIVGQGNNVQNSGRLIGCQIDIKGNNNKLVIGKNTIIRNCLIKISGNDNQIVLGENCAIQKGELWVEDDNGVLAIGGNTTVEQAHFAVTESTTLDIGKDCMFAKEIEVRTGDSHSVLNDKGERINPAKDVKIGDHVWVGNKVIVLKGAQVGNGVVLGAGTIVNIVVDENSLVAGNPAKIIKSKINWKRERLKIAK